MDLYLEAWLAFIALKDNYRNAGIGNFCESNRMIDKKLPHSLVLISQMAAQPHLSVFPCRVFGRMSVFILSLFLSVTHLLNTINKCYSNGIFLLYNDFANCYQLIFPYICTNKKITKVITEVNYNDAENKWPHYKIHEANLV